MLLLSYFGRYHLGSFQALIMVCGLFHRTECLYEDQIGKYDWRHRYIGKAKFAAFDMISSSKKMLVATEENVIAALHMKTGQLLWRRILEEGCHGIIQGFDLSSHGYLLSVSGSVPAIVRNWNLGSGSIMSEWSVLEQKAERFQDVKWLVKDDLLHRIVSTCNDEVEVTTYNSKTGERLNFKKASVFFKTASANCSTVGQYYICINEDVEMATMFYINVLDSNPRTDSIILNNSFSAGLRGPYHINPIPGNDNLIVITFGGGTKIICLKNRLISKPLNLATNNSLFATSFGLESVILETVVVGKNVEIRAMEYHRHEDLLVIAEPRNVLSINNNSLYEPSILTVSSCSNELLQEKMCKFLFVSKDHSMSLVERNKIVWTREESLSRIVTTEIVELPISNEERTIEVDYDQRERGAIAVFIRRIISQFNKFKLFFQKPFGLNLPTYTERADLVRDKFGLQKLIVAVTAAGKIFGIASKTGEIIWQFRIPHMKAFTYTDTVVLYIQRGSQYYPRPCQCSLLATQEGTGNGMIYAFNPITGHPLGALTRLDFKIKQTLLLPTVTESFLHSIIILDNHNRIHVFPESTNMALARNDTYLFTVDRRTAVLTGYSLCRTSAGNIIAHRVWEFVLSPTKQHIIHISTKNTIERVHSQGRVLADRSVLYKYNNPNLIAVVTQGFDSSQKNAISLYLFDAVRGSLVHSVVHRRTKAPVHIVHSENLLVYSYFNDKSRRTEMTTAELYEGKTPSNTTAFSSLSANILPIVEKASYIFPSVVKFIEGTITEKGITSKHILVALSNGGVLELPWMLLDPRRPMNTDFREEGIIPYMPELPFNMDSIVNYNQSIHRMSKIHTSPSRLESTCLVLIYGLDMFYTQVTPSKSFDVLKKDFDYYLIISVLSALVLASCFTKKLASQKIQKQAWK